jgi:hypothetical protein
MIIFDLDGTLANRDHRLHFVDPARNPDYEFKTFWRSNGNPNNIGKWQKKEVGIFFAADYESFEDACDKDTPNAAVVEVLESLSCETPSRLGYDIEFIGGVSFSIAGSLRQEKPLHLHRSSSQRERWVFL